MTPTYLDLNVGIVSHFVPSIGFRKFWTCQIPFGIRGSGAALQIELRYEFTGYIACKKFSRDLLCLVEACLVEVQSSFLPEWAHSFLFSAQWKVREIVKLAPLDQRGKSVFCHTGLTAQ